MNEQTPFPTVGEVVRFLIDAFGLNEGIFNERHQNPTETEKERKKFRRRLNRFADEKNFDMEKARSFIEETFGRLLDEIMPNSKEYKLLIQNYISYFLSAYEEMVLRVDTKGHHRAVILNTYLIQFIIRYIAIFHYAQSKLKTNSLFQFPESKFWYFSILHENEVIYPVQKILSWWIKLLKVEDIKALSLEIPTSSGSDWNGRETWESPYTMLTRWEEGTNLPKANTIIHYFKESPAFNKLQGIEKVSLCLCLLIARGIQFSMKQIESYWNRDRLFQIQSEIINREKEYTNLFSKHNLGNDKLIPFLFRLLINGVSLQDCQIDYNISDSEMSLKRLLEENISWTEPNTSESYHITNSIVSSLEEKPPVDVYAWFFLWYQARFYFLSGDFPRSVEKYSMAFEAGKYRAGNQLKEIIKEGYALAAYLERQDILRSMHKWGMAYRLFEEKYTDIKDWIFFHQKQQFFNIFPVKSLFYDFFPENKLRELEKELEEAKMVSHRTHPSIRWFEKNILNTKENLTHRVKFNYMTYTPIMLYGMKNDADKIKEFIELGVNVNEKNEDNLTALIICIKRRNWKSALKLLECKEIMKSINTTTFKDKDTALGCLIETFNTTYMRDEDWIVFQKVWNALISQKADINQKFWLHQFTPLYLCIRYLKPSISTYEEFDKSQDLILNLRYAAREGKYKKEGQEFFIKESYNRMLHEMEDSFNSKDLKAHLQNNRQYIHRTIEAILSHPKVNVNLPSYWRWTPLMLAAHRGEIEVCKGLLEKGADPYYAADNKSVFDCAMIDFHYETAILLLSYSDITQLLECSHKSLYWYPDIFMDYLTSDNRKVKNCIDEIITQTIDTALPVLLSFMSYITFFKIEEFTPNKFSHYHLFTEEKNKQIIKEQFNSRELKIIFWNDFKRSKNILKEDKMAKKPNHEADIKNPNKGTDGTNKTWDKAQGNRGQQLNPNRKK